MMQVVSVKKSGLEEGTRPGCSHCEKDHWHAWKYFSFVRGGPLRDAIGPVFSGKDLRVAELE